MPPELLEVPKQMLIELEKSLIEKNADILSGKMQPPVTYDDGDQSPVTDYHGQQIMRAKWVTCFSDYNPLATPWMSDWSRVLFCGDYEGMMDILKDKTEEEVQMLLKKREHFGSFGALFHLVFGASLVSPAYMVESGFSLLFTIVALQVLMKSPWF